MAARKPKTEETTDATAEFSFSDVSVQDVAALPKGTRDTAPNPLEAVVKAAVDQGPKALGPLPNGDKAEEAARLIRRAATVNDVSYKMRFTDANDKPVTPKQAKTWTDEIWVYFSISSDKKTREYKPRAYTSKDIREWAQMGPNDKITQEIRNEYRKAHGMEIRER